MAGCAMALFVPVDLHIIQEMNARTASSGEFGIGWQRGIL
jgi:hypothetical protein